VPGPPAVGPDPSGDQGLIRDAVGMAHLFTVNAHRDFVGDRRSPALVRWFVSQVLEDWGIEVGPTRDVVILLADELASNAIEHTGDGFSVELRRRAPESSDVRVEVRDRDPALPTVRDPDPLTAGGRGMLLVDRLASAWGAEPLPMGKVVWFERALG
jgi:anti-sigma regulatory factor (Ser/Thr protein kinase)